MAKDPICGMTVNEKGGLSFTANGKTHFFCSLRCRERFAKENAAQGVTCPVHQGVPFYKNRTFIVALVLVAVIAFSYVIPFLVPFRVAFLTYLKTIWWALLLGLIIGGAIENRNNY